MKNRKVIRCACCGKAAMVEENTTIPFCCGREMEVLPVQEDEKLEDTHAPVISRKDGRLYAYAGAYAHGSVPGDTIEWMLLECEDTYRFCYFKPQDEPKMLFENGEPVSAVYAYCTKHGLWKTEI